MGRRHSTDDEDAIQSGRRKRARVNYRDVENQLDDVLDDEEEEAHSDWDDDEEELSRKTRQRQAQKPANVKKEMSSKAMSEAEDDSFHESASDADEFLDDESDGFQSEFEKEMRRREERQFVARGSDEEDDIEAAYNPRSGKRSKRKSKKVKKSSRRLDSLSRTRSTKRVIAHDDDEEEEDDEDEDEEEEDVDGLIASDNDDTLHQELQDLKDTDDESQRRSARSLRQRSAKPDYVIPPQLTDTLDGLPIVEPEPSTPRRRTGTKESVNRRLFATNGPFGGGNVVSIFGKNQGSGALAAGGADSDSSDDEIVPVSGAKRNSISVPAGMGADKHKKNQNADSDPLGVDMNIDFSAVGGLDNYINQLKEMVALPLLYPEVYQKFGITPPRGVLFHGPPGTGKTLMARALAASCSSEGRNITFFMRKGADCLSKWVGEAERQLRLLFEEARKQQPSIIFFDEIDGLAPVRSSKQEQIHASIVSTLLALMDGMDNRGQVIVIGATNRPDAVDPALRRPGRFDREFYFPLPDINAREQILSIQTKKWDPPLSKDFLGKVAHLTKGYGGADLRALCTEAALNSIQRRYPQIYQSKDKLEIDPDSIQVAARDFMKALDKVVPSSSRSTSSGSAPLPEELSSLLEQPLKSITDKLDKLVPRVKNLTSLEEAQFVDPSENDEDGGFRKHEVLRRLEASRVHRPRLLIAGDAGNGQQYLGSAVLNHLEGFNIQSLDLGQLFGDATRTAENAIIQSFIEARRHKPSIIFIPNVDIWFDTVPPSAKSVLAGLLRSVTSNEKILLLGVADTPFAELDPDLRLLFGLSESNYVNLGKPDADQRQHFFEPLFNALQMRPAEFLDNKKKKKLEKLKKLKAPTQEQKEEDLKTFEKNDMSLKNTLKIKLYGLMDLFKNRYKRFKRPAIEDHLLIHLFEPVQMIGTPRYTRDGNMILDCLTGKKYFNMDLDVIEERLWNGYYCEPKQFLKDINMIHQDAIVSEDREKIFKAAEMQANAVVGVDEISTPEFLEQCKGLKRRERKREEERLKKVQEAEISVDASQPDPTLPDVTMATNITDPNGETSIMITGEYRIGTEGNVALDHAENILKSLNGFDDGAHTNGTSQAQPIEDPFMVEDSSVNEKTAIPSQISTSTDKADVEAGQEEEDEDEEEEDEDEEPEVEDPPFELDPKAVEVVSGFLVSETEGLSVDELEQVNAKLMEVMWEDRHSWDRNTTLGKIRNFVGEIGIQFGKVEYEE